MATVTADRTAGHGRAWVSLAWLLPAIVVAAAVVLGGVAWLTARPVYVQVDGMEETVYTHRATVRALLLDLGLEPHARDRISPGLDSAIVRDMELIIERARPVRILADGRNMVVNSWGRTPRQVLADADMAVETYDELLLDGKPWMADQPLPPVTVAQEAPTFDRGFAWNSVQTKPIQLRIYRAIPIVVQEGGLPYTIDTTAQTVGEALRNAGVILYLGDRVQPSLGSAVTANMHVYIQRSVPVTLQLDGHLLKTRTQAKTVADALIDLGVVIAGNDRVEPALESELYDNIQIVVTRVAEDVEVEEEIAPFETVYVPDPNLPIDTQQVLDPGANGITRHRYRVRYENSQQQSRVLEDTWIAQEPEERRIAYGQRIEPRTETLPDGTAITYWRKITMLATSYSPASAGGNRTRTGDLVREGIVAVDPRIIPLRSQVYVPGYGISDALDTGGGIIARRIDLAYPDATYVPVRRWVDVYLLWPPPSADNITWVLPNYPPVPQ
ncbi:MAG: DUF348 domain-containing protein [Caldilineaceae bacterium]|nr:DUF348 domain-containing protein [Caldilineaceae bacterium]